MRVDGGGEVMVERGLGLAARVREHVEHKQLHGGQAVRVARELRVVPADVRLLAGHLLREQVRLVQKQDDGDALEVDVVHDRVEDVERLLEPIRFPVFRQHLVEFRRRHEEQYRSDRVEALRPLLPLRPLSAHVHEHEGHAVDVDGALGDALGRLPAVQDVLVGRHVVRPSYALQVVEEVAHRITQLKFSPPVIGPFYGSVQPQGVYVRRVMHEESAVQSATAVQSTTTVEVQRLLAHI